MKEYEQIAHEDEVPLEPSTLRAWLEGIGPCSSAPWLHDGVRSGARRLAACDAMKRVEARGKSKVIDAFVHKHIPVGAHRAFDPLHDPLYGPIRAIKDMGFEKTLKVWCPHMASDVLTPMSLPLPGTYKAGLHSLRYRLYAKGLVNVTSVILAPVLNVLIADLLIRADPVGRWRGDPRTPEERDEKLLQAHVWNALISGGLAVAAFVGPSAPAAVIAYGATAAWSALTAGGYYAVAHRAGIEAALRGGATKVGAAAKTAVGKARRLVDIRLPAAAGAEPLSAAAPVRTLVPKKPEVGSVRLGLAAALLTLALMSGRA